VWGIIPAAGRGSRIQPLAFSKELLPVGSRNDGTDDRPVAVSEYIVERMLKAGVTKFCFVIGKGKSDIVEYYGDRIAGAHICYVVQDEPLGLCDALFRALPFIDDHERTLFGLPDTIWFPVDALAHLPQNPLEFLLFPVDRPELFDAVDTDELGNVLSIEVKLPGRSDRWIWGAFATDGASLRRLFSLWCVRGRRDEYLGTLVNAYLASGGRAHAVRSGERYVDVGTLNGYREATRLLEQGAALSVVPAASAPNGSARGPDANAYPLVMEVGSQWSKR
jgi:dTDP-glucose pyrophosphorylase